MRLVTGTDGSVGGQAALRWATAFALAAGAELVVASVWRPRFAEVPPEEFETLTAEATAALDELCAPVRASGVELRSVLVEGDPREQLLAVADAESADLLVVGARGTGEHAHALHVGSVTHHLAHHSQVPLAVIPPATKAAWPAPVVVGVDGSDGSRRALGWCAATLGSLASEVLGVHAEEPLGEFVPHDDPRSWFRIAREQVDEWLAPVRRAGIVTRPVVLKDHPIHALTDTAIAEGAGLVVVGTRGIGGITGLRLGATALKVLHHGHLPVVMIPADTR